MPTPALRNLRAIERDLRREVRGDVALDPATRALYSTAACIYRVRPLGVVAPRDADDVAAVVRYCRTHGIPITPRGAGSGLAGQALGDGIILDFTPHMNRLLDVGEDAVWVEPGLVADALGAALAQRGLWFPPDPSSSAYCTLGGMIANNAAGSHSVKYGTTIDYVEELDVLLADGTMARLRGYELDGPAWRRLLADETREAEIHRDIRRLLDRYGELIRTHQPRTTKNSSGYRLERAVEGGVLNLSRLICGAEGTLGIVLAAKLRVVPLPCARRMAVLHFPDLPAAGRSVLEILDMGPSAIELQDQETVTVIREGRPELDDFLPEPGQSQLFVEFDGEDDREAADRLAAMRRRVCDELALACRCIEPAADGDVARLWAIRKATLPLMYNRPGPKRIVSFIEDVAVPPDQIPTYIDRLYRIFERHGVEAAVYGHASQGNFHSRPFLDLHDPAQVRTMRALADDVFALAIELGGTVSGEHGDGMARTEYLQKLYGPLTAAFAELKRILDPSGLLNPGKKVPDDRHPCGLTANLRFDPDYGSSAFRERLVWPNGGLPAEAERCNGCATCRTLPVHVTRMCPVFRALGREEASPRAKANLLREIIAGRLNGNHAARELERLSDLCLVCGSCKVDCPSKVDVPKLMLEAKAQAAAAGRRAPWRRLFARLDAVTRLAAPFAPLANAACRLRPVRGLIEKLARIDRRRPLPTFVRRPLHRRLARRSGNGDPALERQVVYFPDVFADYSDPSIGEALVRLLERAGIGVVVPPVHGCGILAMCYGDVAAARRTIRHNLAQLARYAREGLDILVTEPTALLCLREAYGDFVTDPAAREVADRSHDALTYLLALRRSGQLDLDLHDLPMTVGYHTPCHSRAAGLEAPALELLADVQGLTVVPVEEGCCGIAGSAGMRRDKYDLSMKIGEALFLRLADEQFAAATTECSACRMQIEHGTAKPCYHPLHILDHAAFGTSLPPATAR